MIRKGELTHRNGSVNYNLHIENKIHYYEVTTTNLLITYWLKPFLLLTPSATLWYYNKSSVLFWNSCQQVSGHTQQNLVPHTRKHKMVGSAPGLTLCYFRDRFGVHRDCYSLRSRSVNTQTVRQTDKDTDTQAHTHTHTHTHTHRRTRTR